MPGRSKRMVRCLGVEHHVRDSRSRSADLASSSARREAAAAAEEAPRLHQAGRR